MPKKKSSSNNGATVKGKKAGPVCTCEDPYKCTCGNRPERPSKGHKWDPVAQAWGGKGHKQKGAALGQAATVAKDKIITTKVGQTTLLPHQRLPSTILREYCQKQKHKPDPQYKQIRRGGGNSNNVTFQYQLTIPTSKSNNKPDDVLRFLPAQAVPNAEQAREEAALLALLHLTPTLPHERKFPEPYRTTWLQALQAQKEQKNNTDKGSNKKTLATQTTPPPTDAKSSFATGTSTAQASTGLQSAVTINRATAQSQRQQARAARNAKIARHEAVRLANAPHPVFMSAQLRQAITRLLTNDNSDIIDEETVNEDKDEAFYLDSMQSDVQDYVEERLHAEGFTRKQARRAFAQSTGSDSPAGSTTTTAEAEWEHAYETTLQWLLVHEDETNLPPSFDPRGRTLDVIVGKPSSLPTSSKGTTTNPHIQEFARRHGLSLPDAALILAADDGVSNDEKAAQRTLWETACRLAQVSPPSATDAMEDGAAPDPSLLEDELEALTAIFADDCHVVRHDNNETEGSNTVELQLPLDGVFRLDIVLHATSYPQSWPVQILVTSESSKQMWTQGLALLVEVARYLSSDAVAGEPVVFALHGHVMELVQTRNELPTVSLTTTSSRQPSRQDTTSATTKKSSTPSAKMTQPLITTATPTVIPRKRPRERAPFWSLSPSQTPPAAPFPTGALKRARAQLPAAQARGDFLQALKRSEEGSHVVLCTGETGCGKSTQLPQFILEEYPMQAKIVVCQPRRLAATGVATRVAEERGERKPGEESVGYVVRGDTALNNKSRLVFCTTGVLLRQLQNKGALDCLTHIVIDEVHERNLDSDILLALLKQCLPTNPHIRVVLMSATLDADRFMKYWPGETPRIHIPGRTFPVQDFLLEDVLALTQYIPPKRKGANGGTPESNADWDNNVVDEDDEGENADEDENETDEVNVRGHSVADLVKRVDETSIDYSLLAQLVRHLIANKDPTDDGSILIFLPGAPEIDRAIEAVRKITRELPVQLLPLHGGLQPKEQNRVFQPAGTGLYKVVFSTNVAETSVTIPDCTIVIDSAREKQSSYDPSNRMPLLLEQFCSKASLKQRRGRAGRVREGVCYKLISKSTMGKLRDHGEPEIRRSALDQTLLSILFLGMECTPTGGFLESLLDPPEREAIASAAASLQSLGALEMNPSSRSYALTPLGVHLAGIPAPPMVGKVLIMGSILGCRDAAIAMAAGMAAARSPFLRIDTRRRFPRKDSTTDQSFAMEQAKQEGILRERKAMFQKVGNSDHALLVAIYQQFQRLERGNPRRQFCDKLGLSVPGMRDLVQLAQQLDAALASVGYRPSTAANRHGQSWRVIRAVAVAGLAPAQLVKVVRPAAAYQETAEGSKEKDGEARQLKFFVRTGAESASTSTSRGTHNTNARDQEERVFVHPSSANFATGSYSCPWLVYFSLVRTSKPFLRDVTECNSYALLLFGGPLAVQASQDVVTVDGWCQLGAHARIGSLMGSLRTRLDALLTQKITDPSFDIANTKEMSVMIRLIMTDGLGK